MKSFRFMPSGLWPFASSLVRFSGGRFLSVWLSLVGAGPVLAAPTILTQPTNQSALVGGGVTFSVSATNSATYTDGFNYGDLSGYAHTNVFYTGRTVGTLTISYLFGSLNDRLTVYYGTNQIHDTGYIGGSQTRTFTVGYGPGTDTSVTVIINEGNNANHGSKWEYHLSMLAPVYYQWQFNGTNISGATNAAYAVSNITTNKAGNYTALVSDSTGTAPSQAAVLTVSGVAAYVDGQLISSTQYAFAGSVSVQLQTGYADGSIYYTLDDTEPKLTSLRYTAAFPLTTNTRLRAIAYNADFSQSGEGQPIAFTKVSGFTLDAVSAGGGSIALNPPGGVYLSNTIVNLIASTNAGWTFLGWLGDASGDRSTNSVAMTQNRHVEAVFGTSFTVTPNSGGTISVAPAAALYPFGTVVRVSATPLAGKYFGIWGDAASGDVNPLAFRLTNANLTVSAGFPPVNAGQAALTVAAIGLGQVTVNPRANVYDLGTNITLAATPDSGQTFLGWTNDASGTNNPLVVTLTTNTLITATFTKRPVLTDTPPLGGMTEAGLRLTLAGELGGRFQLEASTNLTNWAALTILTNTTGRTQFTDPAGTNTPARFYRSFQLP